jgi:tRNA modification GTPase
VIEIHALSSPPLVELMIAECLHHGARAAQPGEFTLRAFLAGKLDLTRAEAVLGVIEAQNRDELQQALVQLAGGLARPLDELRNDLLNLLADVEAGLDFSDEDLRFVQQDELLRRLSRALAIIITVQKQLAGRTMTSKAFRAVLAGPPNVGKSSLFNALCGKATALVSPKPGTTRDYLEGSLEIGGMTFRLVDTAGWRPPGEEIEAAAQTLGKDQAQEADLVLWCQEASGPLDIPAWSADRLILVATKCDLHSAQAGWMPTSAVTGEGLEALKEKMVDRARSKRSAGIAPSLSRCRHHVEACLQSLRRAHALALESQPPELLALDLHEALDHVGAMVGAIYTDDLLDRIFSRFCIGK